MRPIPLVTRFFLPLGSPHLFRSEDYSDPESSGEWFLEGTDPLDLSSDECSLQVRAGSVGQWKAQHPASSSTTPGVEVPLKQGEVGVWERKGILALVCKTLRIDLG